MRPAIFKPWLLLLAFWCLALPATARVREASDSLIDSRTESVLDVIPASGLALPPFLSKPKDVYLLVTAGAAYTDVRVVGGPGASGLALGRALEDAATGTPLAGRTVMWSDEDRPAAQVSEGHGRFLSRASVNTVSIAPLVASLRRAGYAPHLLLRVPRYVQPSALPSSHFGTRTFRWYDDTHLAGRSPLSLRARLAGVNVLAAGRLL